MPLRANIITLPIRTLPMDCHDLLLEVQSSTTKCNQVQSPGAGNYPLTDAANFLYLEPTLPQLTTLGCALLWLRVSEATPPSKAVRVFY